MTALSAEALASQQRLTATLDPGAPAPEYGHPDGRLAPQVVLDLLQFRADTGHVHPAPTLEDAATITEDELRSLLVYAGHLAQGNPTLRAHELVWTVPVAYGDVLFARAGR